MVTCGSCTKLLPATIVLEFPSAGMQWFWVNASDTILVAIAAGLPAMVATLLFLRVWQPKRIWRFEEERAEDAAKLARNEGAIQHTGAQIAKAWMPFAILSLFVLLWAFPTLNTPIAKAPTPPSPSLAHHLPTF